ncbi:hypothetical protein TWF281_009936 [Arthrobotrys megalospora]
MSVAKMAKSNRPNHLAVTRTFESITFSDRNHIVGRPSQPVELITRRGDILDITFPSPTSRQIVRLSMNSKSATIYWAEGTGSLIVYVYDKHSSTGYPTVNVRNETGFRGWTTLTNKSTIHTDVAKLLGTPKFGENRLIALKWNRVHATMDQKPLRKAICHTKWQNVSSLELRRRCAHLLHDAGMNYNDVSVEGVCFLEVRLAELLVDVDVVSFFGSGASGGPSGSAAPSGSAGPSRPGAPSGVRPLATQPAQQGNVQQAKRPVRWEPLTPEHLVKLESLQNPGFNPITSKRPGTIRPPAVFDVGDADPFGSISTSSRVGSAAQPPRPIIRQAVPPTIQQAAPPVVQQEAQQPGPNPEATGQGQAARPVVEFPPGVRNPPRLPPLPPHILARIAAAPRERGIPEASNGLSDTRVRAITTTTEGVTAGAEAEGTPLPGPPAGMLIDFGGDPEISAPEGVAGGGRLQAEAYMELASELEGLEFLPTEEATLAEDQQVTSNFWEDLERWNEKTMMEHPR